MERAERKEITAFALNLDTFTDGSWLDLWPRSHGRESEPKNQSIYIIPYIFSPLTLSALLARAGLETVTSLYKSAVGASAADDHVERTQRTKFITVFARPGDAAQPPAGHVDVDRPLALQRASLVAEAS